MGGLLKSVNMRTLKIIVKKEINVTIYNAVDQILQENLYRKTSTKIDSNNYYEGYDTEMVKDDQDLYKLENLNP